MVTLIFAHHNVASGEIFELADIAWCNGGYSVDGQLVEISADFDDIVLSTAYHQLYSQKLLMATKFGEFKVNERSGCSHGDGLFCILGYRRWNSFVVFTFVFLRCNI